MCLLLNLNCFEVVSVYPVALLLSLIPGLRMYLIKILLIVNSSHQSKTNLCKNKQWKKNGLLHFCLNN